MARPECDTPLVFKVNFTKKLKVHGSKVCINFCTTKISMGESIMYQNQASERFSPYFSNALTPQALTLQKPTLT